jgi:hypothetical protein
MKNRVSILIVMIICSSNVIAQKVNDTFLVLCFEEKFKVSQHDTKEYYWIVSTDSLETKNLELAKLFISDFSSDNLIDCFSGEAFDPFLIFDKTNYSFEAGYLNSLDYFESIVRGHREKLQTIKIKWSNGQSKTVSIYGTVVKGSFCISNYHAIGRERTGYSGKVAIPYSSFELVDGFWTSNGDQFRSIDFSQWNYSIID